MESSTRAGGAIPSASAARYRRLASWATRGTSRKSVASARVPAPPGEEPRANATVSPPGTATTAASGGAGQGAPGPDSTWTAARPAFRADAPRAAKPEADDSQRTASGAPAGAASSSKREREDGAGDAGGADLPEPPGRDSRSSLRSFAKPTSS